MPRNSQMTRISHQSRERERAVFAELGVGSSTLQGELRFFANASHGFAAPRVELSGPLARKRFTVCTTADATGDCARDAYCGSAW